MGYANKFGGNPACHTNYERRVGKIGADPGP